MQNTLDEAEVNHVYACLQVGGEKFSKLKKDLEKLGQDTAPIDAELTVNAKLRREFNPRAEEEARAASRRDDAQMDLTDVASSGETGGGIPAGQVFRINTGPATTPIEIRDALLELGIAVQVADVSEWSDDERNSAVVYMEAVQQALANGDEQKAAAFALVEPVCVERDGTTVARLQELLAAGPYRVREVLNGENGTDYSVVREAAEGVDEETDTTLDDKLDAEIRAARLNKTELQRADMNDDEITEWANAGPWKPSLLGEDGWFIVAGTQEEFCDTQKESIGRAARYNRSIAQRTSEPVEPMYEVENEQSAEAAVANEQEVAMVSERADCCQRSGRRRSSGHRRT